MQEKGSEAEAPQPEAPDEPAPEHDVIPETKHEDDSSCRSGTRKSGEAGLVSMEQYEKLQTKINNLEQKITKLEERNVDYPAGVPNRRSGNDIEALVDQHSTTLNEMQSAMGTAVATAVEFKKHRRRVDEANKQRRRAVEARTEANARANAEANAGANDEANDEANAGDNSGANKNTMTGPKQSESLGSNSQESDANSLPNDVDRQKLASSTGRPPQSMRHVKFREWHSRTGNHGEFLIDVLVDEPDTGAAEDPTTGQGPLPERIRIIYPHHCGMHGLNGLPSDPIRELVILRPYKVLVRTGYMCRNNLRDLMTRILHDQAKAGVESDPAGNNPAQKDGVAAVLEEEKDGPRIPYPSDLRGAAHEFARRLERPSKVNPWLLRRLFAVGSVVDFIDTYIEPKKEYVRSSHCTSIEFSNLWFLFEPGTDIIDCGGRQAYRVLRVTTPHHQFLSKWRPLEKLAGKSDIRSLFMIHCVSIDYDGAFVGPRSTNLVISPYAGERRITALPVYPLRFAREKDLREQLIKRGKMFFDLCSVRSMYYTGHTAHGEEIDSQVVIDAQQAVTHSPDMAKLADGIETINTSVEKGDTFLQCGDICCMGEMVADDGHSDKERFRSYCGTLIPAPSFGKPPSLIIHPRTLNDIMAGGNTPTDDEYVVMSGSAFGFVLRSRKWARLALDYLSYDSPNSSQGTKEAFDSLVLPDGHRAIVQGLVTQHFRNREKASLLNERTDLIRGKGKGLIMLLHGAPGVGKTTTAEGIAERFNKPLFQITCGDLGTTAKEVEAELEKNFTLASKWGCILLLDEADVFLAQRERKDFVRNGLVAVFLRVLEYYTGILFLTTNRLGDIDEAFASRIHMSLRYPALDEDKTKRVFKLNLDMMKSRYEDRGQKLRFDEASLMHFAAQHYADHSIGRWNGRQIRNACQTALALAEFEATENSENEDEVSLGFAHFQTVQTAYLDFSQYLGDIFGTDQERRAHELQLRADERTKVAGSGSRIDQHVAGRQHRATSSVGRQYEEHRGEPALGRGQLLYDPTFRPSSQHVGVAQAAAYPAEGAGQPRYRHDPSSYAHAGIPGAMPAPTPYGRGAVGTPGHLYPSYEPGPGATPPPPPAPTSTDPPVHGHTYPNTHGPYPR